MGGLSDARPSNQFAPLRPEQEAMLSRQAIQESMSPIDMTMPMAGLGLGALGGYGAARIGQALAGVSKHDAPLWLRSLINGGAAGYGAIYGGIQGAMMQSDAENTLLDAEGQPGGFYGQMPRR